MTVGGLLARVSSAELTEWIAYEQVTGPLGPARDDVLMAVLAATVSNANRGKGRKARPADFLPKWDRGAGLRMAWQDMLTAVKGINRTLGGADKTKDEEAGSGGYAGRDPGAAGHRRRRPDRRRPAGG